MYQFCCCLYLVILFHSAWVKPRRRLDYYDDDEEEDDDLSEWVSIFIMRDAIVSSAATIRGCHCHPTRGEKHCMTTLIMAVKKTRDVVVQWFLCLTLDHVGIQLWPYQ